MDVCRDISRGPDALTAFARWVRYTYDTDNQCRNISYDQTLEWIRENRFVYAYDCTTHGRSWIVTSQNSTGNIFPNVIGEDLYESRCRDHLSDL